MRVSLFSPLSSLIHCAFIFAVLPSFIAPSVISTTYSSDVFQCSGTIFISHLLQCRKATINPDLLHCCHFQFDSNTFHENGAMVYIVEVKRFQDAVKELQDLRGFLQSSSYIFNSTSHVSGSIGGSITESTCIVYYEDDATAQLVFLMHVRFSGSVAISDSILYHDNAGLVLEDTMPPPITRTIMLRDETYGLRGNFNIIDLATETSVAPPSYDHLTRTDQWAAGVCAQHSKPCKHSTPKYFTLHGIWPSNKAPPHPQKCTPPSFDFNNITSLIPDLSIAWPNLHGANKNMWTYQWNKHGVCSPFNEYDYFKMGIDIWQEYNLSAILENYGVVPGYYYNAVDISNAIEYSNIGVKPSLICIKGWLVEIQLCLDPMAYSYRKCPIISVSCNTNLVYFSA